MNRFHTLSRAKSSHIDIHTHTQAKLSAMCDRICVNCSKFKPDEMPEQIKTLSKNVFWNEDGTEKDQ